MCVVCDWFPSAVELKTITAVIPSLYNPAVLLFLLWQKLHIVPLIVSVLIRQKNRRDKHSVKTFQSICKAHIQVWCATLAVTRSFCVKLIKTLTIKSWRSSISSVTLMMLSCFLLLITEEWCSFLIMTAVLKAINFNRLSIRVWPEDEKQH